MAEKSPAFQWYPKDCDTDEKVRAMDDREFGFYVRCLNHSWLNGGLPIDPKEIMRVLGRPPSYTSKVWPRVEPCFHVDKTGTRLINERQERQRKSQQEFRESRRNASAVRWGKQVDSTCNAHAQHMVSSASASPSASAIYPRASEKDSTVLGSSGDLPPALIPIQEALKPHARAIGKEPDDELVRKIAEASQNQPLVAASWIGKTWLRRFSERAVHRQPPPESLAYWLTAIREEAVKGWQS